MADEKLPEAIDLSHHLSRLSKARVTSPLKGLQKYWTNPGVIVLAGGLPSAAYFPFASLSGEGLIPDSFPISQPEGSSAFSWLWKLFGSSSARKEQTTTLTVNKYPSKPGEINLAQALQYGPATGLVDLQKIIQEFSGKVFRPGYKNFTTLINCGNTDGWSKAVTTLCNPGECVLTSEWTYPSALSVMRPYGVEAIPVAMDGQGMRADALEKVLAEWDEEARQMPRPRVIYTVPVGQNPTGATAGAQRKKEIYAICVKYDIIIVEDDPYYFLQMGEYVPKEQRANYPSDLDDTRYIESLAPSYLRFDYQGRVVRLDTFSKTIAPGCRLGWFTCNPLFAERLERQGETTTQSPSGFAQTMVASLLLRWKFTGYLRWLKALGNQYAVRRDHMVDCLAEEFSIHITPASAGYRGGCNVYEASLKPKRSSKYHSEKTAVIFSLVPPSAGMFVWLKMHFEGHPGLQSLGYKVLEEKLFIELAEAGVLLGPGNIFSATPISDEAPGDGHFRISFSNAEFDVMKKAMQIFAEVVEKFMEE